jgi:hypothetical protein
MVPMAEITVETDDGPVSTRGNLYVNPRVGFQLLLGRPWGRRNRAHLIEDNDGTRIAFWNKNGWHNITPVSNLKRQGTNTSQTEQKQSPAEVYATRRTQEVPETDEEEDDDIGSNVAHIGAQDLEDRGRNFPYSPVAIGEMEPPEPGQRREVEESDKEEEQGMVEYEVGSAGEEEAQGQEYPENQSELNTQIEESTVRSVLHETLIQKVLRGVTDQYWEKFQQLMQQEKQDDEARWRRLCDDISLEEKEEFDIDDYREETNLEDKRDGREAEPSQTLDIPDDESEPELPSHVRTSRSWRKAGGAAGKTRTTKLRRTSRTSYQTEKAQGDEYLRYIGKY